MKDKLASLREEYIRAGLSEADLAADPLSQFTRWFEEARDLIEPNAMVLATSSAAGVPSARIVLLKGLDERGFVFFTNLASRKANDLAENPRCSLLFPWHRLERQVRVEGSASLLSSAEVAAYFSTRPRGAQLGAWASRQSQVTTSAELNERYDELDKRFGDEVPAPSFWGGYVVTPESVEFWQGRTNRMHDRLRYRRGSADSLHPTDEAGWIVERLAP